MKLNNKNAKSKICFINSILGLLLIIGLLMISNFIPSQGILKGEYLIGILSAFLTYIAIRGWHYYELDTSGEGFTLKVERIDLFSFISTKEKKIDLPKYKLQNYLYNKGVLNDDFTLFINSRKSKANTVKVKFRFSLLSEADREKIVSELEKIISSNNQYQLDSKVA